MWVELLDFYQKLTGDTKFVRGENGSKYTTDEQVPALEPEKKLVYICLTLLADDNHGKKVFG